MSSQGNNINLLKQIPFYGKTIKPRVKDFTNAKLLSELPFFEKSIKANVKQPKNYYKNNSFINSPKKKHALNN